jgi:hypothetical protein
MDGHPAPQARECPVSQNSVSRTRSGRTPSGRASAHLLVVGGVEASHYRFRGVPMAQRSYPTTVTIGGQRKKTRPRRLSVRILDAPILLDRNRC